MTYLPKPYLAIGHELVLADSETDEGDALDGFSPQQPELGRVSVLHDVLETGHEPVVVGEELLFSRLSDRGDRRHHLSSKENTSILLSTFVHLIAPISLAVHCTIADD